MTNASTTNNVEMSLAFEELFSIASPTAPLLATCNDSRYEPLMPLYARTNGLFAFESSLHVFPLVATGAQVSVHDWNSRIDWATVYGLDKKSEIVFAEDAIGGQFVLSTTGVTLLDLETGERETVASSFVDWMHTVVQDYDYLTAYGLAHDWQVSNAALKSNERLAPITPFILGGQYIVANLYAVDRTEMLSFRAELRSQLKDLPAGASVQLIVAK